MPEKMTLLYFRSAPPTLPSPSSTNWTGGGEAGIVLVEETEEDVDHGAAWWMGVPASTSFGGPSVTVVVVVVVVVVIFLTTVLSGVAIPGASCNSWAAVDAALGSGPRALLDMSRQALRPALQVRNIGVFQRSAQYVCKLGVIYVPNQMSSRSRYVMCCGLMREMKCES
jgi:hypothetical protein